jgi:hypothetical protein
MALADEVGLWSMLGLETAEERSTVSLLHPALCLLADMCSVCRSMMEMQSKDTDSSLTTHGSPPSPHLDSCPPTSTHSPCTVPSPSLSLQLSPRSPSTPESMIPLHCPSPTLYSPSPQYHSSPSASLSPPPSTPLSPHWDSSPTSMPPSPSLQLWRSSPVLSPRSLDSAHPLSPLSLSQPLSPVCHFTAHRTTSRTNPQVLSLHQLMRSLYTHCTAH